MDADALLADLDPDQRRAVTAESHLVAVIAGAGSGKTRVLTRRVAWRIATEQADPRHTLALTFTREAAGELRRRLTRLGLRERVEAGTFHSVMLAVLKQRWNDTGRRPRHIVSDRRRLVGDVLDPAQRRAVDGLVAEIDWATARGIGAERYAAAARRQHRRPHVGIERVAAVFADFEQLKRTRGIIDFDDVLTLVIRDLEHDDEFSAAVRWRFRHLLVDEAQDLNPLQHRLIDLLRNERNDLFLVGDPAQAIFGFNGADPTLLVDVETRFPGIEIIRLPVNHRCTPQIVSTGVHVLAAAGQPTELISHRGDGALVAQFAGADEVAEANFVASEIVRLDPNLVRAGEVAVLARTNAQLAAFAKAIEAAGMPVRRSATASGTPLQAAVRQVSTLGSASQLRAWAHDTLDAHDALLAARAELASTSAADGRFAARAEQAVDDLEADRRVAAALLDYLRDQQLGDGAGFRAWVAMTNPFDDRSTGGVDLLSFHAAKGREWHTVFVAGVESSLVPHKSATTNEARAEEGRLLYVAATRASDRLVLTRADRRGGYARTISPFVADLDLSEPAPAPLPSELLRRRRARVDPTLAALRAWRDEAARRAGVIPTQLCSDRDLSSIARHKPSSADDLVAVTSFGSIMAERLAPQLIPIVSGSAAESELVNRSR